jgi:AcrR family transcriptional regulator
VQDVTVPERWTQARRRQHTRDLLLDAAEEVFARRGFDGASLEEIAENAGYTRGAIYKHFGSKEELFLEANKRFNERYVHAFVDVLDPGQPLEGLDIPAIAERWREMAAVQDADRWALGMQFQLYILRNPEARARAAQQRRETAEMIAGFMEEQAARLGLTMTMPPLTLARIALNASDGIHYAALIDERDNDLYEAFLELLIKAWEQQETQPSERVRDQDDAKDRKRRRRTDPDHAVG